MNDYKSVAAGILDRLQLGTLDDRSALREAVEAYVTRQGYTAQILSFQRGHLILGAQPAEARLLRYDLAALKQALHEQAPGVTVERISVRSRPGTTAA